MVPEGTAPQEGRWEAAFWRAVLREVGYVECWGGDKLYMDPREDSELLI